MTPLRQKLIDDLAVRGLSENTQISYVQSMKGLACHYRRSPDQLTPQQVQDYLLYLLKQRGLSPSSCNTVRYLYIAQDRQSAIPSPLDLLEFPGSQRH